MTTMFSGYVQILGILTNLCIEFRMLSFGGRSHGEHRHRRVTVWSEEQTFVVFPSIVREDTAIVCKYFFVLVTKISL